MKIINLEDYQVRAEMLKVLAHPTRLEILYLLESHPRLSVTQMKDRLGCDQTHASQHLKQMKLRGILGSQRNGKFIFYFLKEKSCGELVKVIDTINLA